MPILVQVTRSVHQKGNMGKKDSSLTRVKPIFDRLREVDPTGVSWLNRLIMLPSLSDNSLAKKQPQTSLTRFGWGDNEVSLDPPVSLLSWLIRNPRKPLSGGLSKDPIKKLKREEWINWNHERIIEGLNLLGNQNKGEDWHIFEGKTKPDVFLETDDLIVVIEGKRTESGPTTKTKWMKTRHQMLRHLDCAWEIRGKKKVTGFFIVDHLKCNPSISSKQWMKYEQNTTSQEALSQSLPHRGPEEQEEISSCFTGVTTWQQVCSEFSDFGLVNENLPDTIN